MNGQIHQYVNVSSSATDLIITAGNMFYRLVGFLNVIYAF